MSAAFSLLLSTFVATSITQSPAAPPVEPRVVARTAEGPHFRAVAHFDSQLAADETLAAAEAVVPFATIVYGAIALPTDTRIEIHLYPGEREYLEVESRVTHGAFARNLAFTDARTFQAHVALQPPIPLAAFEQGGTPLATKRNVAHEAVHAWSHRAWAHAGRLPFWFAEGAATWAADEALRARGYVTDPMEDPFASTNALLVQALLTRAWLPPLASIVDGLPGGLTFDERYAVAGRVFAFLRDPARAELFARVRDAVSAAARDADPNGDVTAIVARACRAAMGDEAATAAIQSAFEAHVRGLRPGWEETFRALWPAGDGWVQCASAEANAMAWRTTRAGDAAYAIEGDVALLPGPTSQMNLLLARTEDGFVQVSFVAGHGVDVFTFDRRLGPDAAWTKIASAPVAGFDAGRFHAFRVVVEAPTVTVWLGDKPVCAPRLEGRSLGGAFGLGALARSSGLWRKIAQKRL